jgi:hypothetical protein
MREQNDLRRVIREAGWLGTSFGAALGLTYLVEDKENPLLFLTVSFYAISGLFRLIVRLVRRSP